MKVLTHIDKLFLMQVIRHINFEKCCVKAFFDLIALKLKVTLQYPDITLPTMVLTNLLKILVFVV